MLWSLRYDASYLQKHTRYMQTFQQESENGRAHLVALLSVWPSTAQNLLVLLGQVSDSPAPFPLCPHVGILAISRRVRSACAEVQLQKSLIGARGDGSISGRCFGAPEKHVSQ